MANMYAYLAGVAQSAGLLYFVAMFLGVVAYALWPGNRTRFERAARTPLNED
jgi:cytochrome c oxidase cbb3-type subunit IV